MNLLTFLMLGCKPDGGLTVYKNPDNDADTFTEADGDCNDGNATVYPGATEICDSLDNDCDGVIDEDPVDSDASSLVRGRGRRRLRQPSLLNLGL